jgi:hypothetical protein
MVLKHGRKIKYKCLPKKNIVVFSSPVEMCPSLNKLISEARYSPASSAGSPTIGMVGSYGMRVVM